MTVRLQVPPRFIRGNDDGIAVDAAASLAACRPSLQERHPELAAALWQPDGSPRPFVRWFVNGIDVRYLRGMDTPLEDGDEVVAIPERLLAEEPPG